MSDGVQVRLVFGDLPGVTVYDSDVAMMTAAEFQEFWGNVGIVVRKVSALRKAARERVKAKALSDDDVRRLMQGRSA